MAGDDPEAFGVFYDRHVRMMFAYYRRTVSAELTADLTAETFADAFESRRRYRDTQAPAVIECSARAVDDRLLQQEAVHLVVEVDVLDPHPSRPQPPRVGASLVPQREEGRPPAGVAWLAWPGRPAG